jgi:hypothetical protein
MSHLAKGIVPRSMEYVASAPASVERIFGRAAPESSEKRTGEKAGFLSTHFQTFCILHNLS